MIQRLESGARRLLVFDVLRGGCLPTMQLQAPEKPICFEVNINITEHKRLQVDKELLELIERCSA